MDDRERQLEETVDDLAGTLETLRGELAEPPRGPLGLPRPPTPGEFLRLTERYTIPALISLLETSIRTLDLLAAAIRVADGRPLDGDATGRRRSVPARTDRIATASRRTLETLDDALADLQSAAAGGEPENPELQRLLSEARELRSEVDDRLADATSTDPAPPDDPDPVNIEVESGDEEAGDSESEGVAEELDAGVDVDQELESIKREFDDSDPAEDVGGVDRQPGPGDGSADRDAGSADDADSGSDDGDDVEFDAGDDDSDSRTPNGE